MDASVIIPTYNRAQSLGQTITSALQLDYPKDRYEIIVVDNASDDDTHAKVDSLRGSAATRNLHYVREENLGLHNARHAGARAAKGHILLFTDDDAFFDPEWLKAYAKAFESHSEMVAAGGPVRPSWEAPPPKWLLDFIEGRDHFGPLSIMEPFQDFQLSSECYFFGVNMAVRREIVFKVGGFNPELIGNFTVGDGESGLLRKLQERQWLIGYVPDAVVYHRIPQRRMTLMHLRRWQAHLAGAQLYARYHEHMPGRTKLVLDILHTVFAFSPTWFSALFFRFKTSELGIKWQLDSALGKARLNYMVRLFLDKDMQRIVACKDWLSTNWSA